MTSVTKFASVNKHVVPCVVELLTPIHLNTIGNTPSYKPGLYGMYVNIWTELKYTGKIAHMEQLVNTRYARRCPKRRRIIKQAIHQYLTIKSYRSVARPTREFMRIVQLVDILFDVTNTFNWVDITFLRNVINTLNNQLSYIGISSNLSFEHKIGNMSLRGRCDIYDKENSIVIELKTCRFITKEHFIQVNTYKKLAHAHRAYLLNCVDGGIWKIL